MFKLIPKIGIAFLLCNLAGLAAYPQITLAHYGGMDQLTKLPHPRSLLDADIVAVGYVPDDIGDLSEGRLYKVENPQFLLKDGQPVGNSTSKEAKDLFFLGPNYTSETTPTVGELDRNLLFLKKVTLDRKSLDKVGLAPETPIYKICGYSYGAVPLNFTNETGIYKRAKEILKDNPKVKLQPWEFFSTQRLREGYGITNEADLLKSVTAMIHYRSYTTDAEKVKYLTTLLQAGDKIYLDNIPEIIESLGYKAELKDGIYSSHPKIVKPVVYVKYGN